jgi:hypothetical protein
MGFLGDRLKIASFTAKYGRVVECAISMELNSGAVYDGTA